MSRGRFTSWGKPAQCYRALLSAEQASPDEVRYRKPIQTITAGLLTRPTANTLPGSERLRPPQPA